MKAIFLDCNDQLAPVWARVLRPDDPPIDVNRKAFARDELPKIIGGYDIAIDDHSYMKSSIKSAVVFGSTVTAFSSGALGAFTLAHSSTILAACVGEASAISTAAAANRLRFMNILPE